MASQSHPNPANRTARIDRMLRMIDPGGTDQNALAARTSIHQPSALHTAALPRSGLLQRLQKLPLLAVALGGVWGLLAAGSALGLLPAASPSQVITSDLPPLLLMPNDGPNPATDTTDPSLVSAASVWPGHEIQAPQPAPTF